MRAPLRGSCRGKGSSRSRLERKQRASQRERDMLLGETGTEAARLSGSSGISYKETHPFLHGGGQHRRLGGGGEAVDSGAERPQLDARLWIVGLRPDPAARGMGLVISRGRAKGQAPRGAHTSSRPERISSK